MGELRPLRLPTTRRRPGRGQGRGGPPRRGSARRQAKAVRSSPGCHRSIPRRSPDGEAESGAKPRFAVPAGDCAAMPRREPLPRRESGANGAAGSQEIGGSRANAPPAPPEPNRQASRSLLPRSRPYREAGRGSPRAPRLVRAGAAPRRAARPSAGRAGSAATAGAARAWAAAPRCPPRLRPTMTARRKRDRQSAASAAAATGSPPLCRPELHAGMHLAVSAPRGGSAAEQLCASAPADRRPPSRAAQPPASPETAGARRSCRPWAALDFKPCYRAMRCDDNRSRVVARPCGVPI